MTDTDILFIAANHVSDDGWMNGAQILDFARALLSASKPAAPEGWAFKVTESDGRTWLTVITPFGSSATLGCASNNDNGQTIGGQVLTQLKDALAALPAAPAQSGEPVAFRGPAKFTTEEVMDGYRGIRWIMADGVYGRPSNCDVRDYLERTPLMNSCTCEKCKAFYAAPPAQTQAALAEKSR